MMIILCDNCGTDIKDHGLVRARTCLQELEMKRRITELIETETRKNERELKELKNKLTQGKHTK